MKKWTILVSALLLIFVLAACGSNGSSSSKDSSKNTKSSASASKTNTKASKKQQEAQKQMQQQIKKGMIDDGKTVAVVNGTKITGKEYNSAYQSVAQQLYMTAQQQGNSSNSAIAKKAKQQTVQSLVGQKLIIQDAKSKGYKASDKQIKTQYDQMVKQYGGEKKLQSLLKAQNMTTDSLKKNISQQIVFKNYVNKEIGQEKVTDKEIQNFYDQYSKSQKNAPDLKKIKPQIKQQIEQQKQNQAIKKVVDKLNKQGKVDIKI